jgi:hypothetical protein
MLSTRQTDPGLLVLVVLVVLLAFFLATPRASRLPRGQERIAILTPFGPIEVVLDDSNAPMSAQALLDLAKRKDACESCEFVRAEPRPPAGSDGPPYALLQGSLAGHQDILPQYREGTKRTIHPGDFVLIPNSEAFYIALARHDDWSSSHTVVGRVAKLTIVDVIVVQRTKLFVHPEYGTHMQMLLNPVSFRLSDPGALLPKRPSPTIL